MSYELWELGMGKGVILIMLLSATLFDNTFLELLIL
jgi:hypothetical protein